MIEKRVASWKSKKYYRGFSTIVVGCSLIEAATSEVIGNDHIRNSVKDELDVLCVGSTSHVTVNLFGCGLILGLKLGLNVCSSLSVLLSPCKKNEFNFLSSRITHRRLRYLCILGNKSSVEISGFFLRTGPSCSRKGWWRCRRTIYCCRWNQITSDSLAFDSGKWKISNDAGIILGSLQWSHPRAALGRIPTWPRRKWWRWHLRSSGSTFYVLTVGHQRRTACKDVFN